MDNKPDTNSGVIPFHISGASLTEKTVVITGPSRSGTTMMAQIVKTLGIPLGDHVDINLLEDVEIREATKAKDVGRMKSIITSRNAEKPVWGWKYPGTLEYLAQITGELRNPHLIFLFRDPIATSVRNRIYEGQDIDLIDTVEDALNYMKLATTWMKENRHPSLCVSYEKALLSSESVVNAVVDFLGLSVDDSLKAKAVEQIQLGNTRYLSSKLWETHVGFIDALNEGKLMGWAHISDEPEPAELDLKINLKKVERIVADGFRQDLKDNGIGDGNAAFEIDISPYLQKGILNRIEVVFAETEYPLRGSPKFV